MATWLTLIYLHMYKTKDISLVYFLSKHLQTIRHKGDIHKNISYIHCFTMYTQSFETLCTWMEVHYIFNLADTEP